MCDIDWQILLEYVKVIVEILKVFLSWPVAAATIAVVFIRVFKGSISRWIETRNFKGKFGETSFETTSDQHMSTPNTGVNSLNETVTNAVNLNAEITTTIQEIPEELRDEPNIIKIVDFAKTNPIQVVKEFLALSDAYLFERIYARIFGSQLSYLASLSTHTDWAFTEPTVHPFYQTYLQRGGAKDYDVGKYVVFLREVGLVEHRVVENTPQTRITKKGSNFLDYVLKNYPAEWNLKSL